MILLLKLQLKMANILKIKLKMLHILSYLHIIPIIVRKRQDIRPSLYINDTPYIQRSSKREYQTAEDNSRRSPLDLTMLSVIHIQQTDLYEQQYSKHNVYNRENDVVGYGLYLPLCLIPGAFYSSCNIALGVSIHNCKVHK